MNINRTELESNSHLQQFFSTEVSGRQIEVWGVNLSEIEDLQSRCRGSDMCPANT
jgi:hypothetical protein